MSLTTINLLPLRRWLHRVIFEADTMAGRIFDVVLLVCIGVSVLVAMLESVERIPLSMKAGLRELEWYFTYLFTVEYALRLWVVARPWTYAKSFYGVVDLLAVLPSYLSLFVPGMQALIMIRSLRALRLFRVFKMLEYMEGSNVLLMSLWHSRHRIIVFGFTMMVIVTVVGSIMYIVEGREHGFTSIPTSMYWAVVTLTTVGYGDISPQTPVGKMIASLVMLLGYAIIAVPTGIITAEYISRANSEVKRTNTGRCWHCGTEGHADDAIYCRRCGLPMRAVEGGPEFEDNPLHPAPPQAREPKKKV